MGQANAFTSCNKIFTLLGMKLFKSHQCLQAIWEVPVLPFTTTSSYKIQHSKIRGPAARVTNTEERGLIHPHKARYADYVYHYRASSLCCK